MHAIHTCSLIFQKDHVTHEASPHISRGNPNCTAIYPSEVTQFWGFGLSAFS